MEQIAVHEILLHYGQWIEHEPFIELIMKKRNVKDRQAYNLIKKAYDKGEIKKFIFPDKTTMYGLVEFGEPTSEKITYPKTSTDTIKAAERYFQWRGSREGGGVRFYKAMFGSLPEEKQK